MLFRKIWTVLPIILTLAFLNQGCVSSVQSPTSQSIQTINPTNSPPVSFTVVSPLLSSTPTPNVSLPTGSDLTFEPVVETGNLGGSYSGESAQIQVVSSVQTSLPEGIEWVNPEFKTVILALDYAKYFVVMVFNGSRGGIYSDLKILKIWQNTGTVFVLAHFNDFVPKATSLPASNSQYQVVKISRTQITRPGAITFKLLDESGQERATTIQNIPQ